MNITGKMKLSYLILVVIFNYVYVETRANHESSEEYLQKVMFQLQEFNVPSSVNVYDRLSWRNNHKNVPTYENKQNYQRINKNERQNGNYKNQSAQRYNVPINEKIEFHRADFENSLPYYPSQPSTIIKVQEPEVLGYTRAELAAMYKNALDKGSTVSLSSLTNAVSSGEMPQVTQTHAEFPVNQPLYQYYFFPLKTFMSEFKRNHGYKTIPEPAFDNKVAAQVTQTQLSHPLFAAISTFVTMAIVFMMSVLFLPKLTQLDIFHARSIQDDFFYLSNIVKNAIEHYNVLEKC
ncbi:uncharacterized protein LOC114875811 isoform X1 [Osmia bicornis bicornis]|uniref:uncharacterized protein LOC114875811 isoform X1 n=2 Tax=Osmia bicornis bicornis TaxID=1437191 RepID=UPI0010F88B45|nr:uncharacterized protein LOC114875811 isoform X1 [Osmia bicornis bicornis]